MQTPGIRDIAAAKTALGSVLVIDDDVHVRSTIKGWLTNFGWTPVCVAAPSAALRAAKDPTLTVALVDYRLGDVNSGVRLGRVLRSRYGLPFILFSGHLTTAVVVEAMRAGALDVLDKPLSEVTLTTGLKELARTREGVHLNDRLHSSSCDLVKLAADDLCQATIRWARLVLKACSARDDPRRIRDWASAVGTSEGTIDEICRICDVNARQSRDLARTLRAIYLARTLKTPVWTHFAAADERTISSLLGRAELHRASRDVSLRQFFQFQRFVPVDRLCLRELAHLAANSCLFF